MERARQAGVLIFRAKDIFERGGDHTEALQALDEAVEMLKKIERDARRFHDLLAQPVRVRT